MRSEAALINVKAALIDFFCYLGAAEQVENTTLTYYHLIHIIYVLVNMLAVDYTSSRHVAMLTFICVHPMNVHLIFTLLLALV